MNNSTEPITVEETQKILEQMKNCTCKIKSNEIYGTGFFCRLRFMDNSFMKVLTTSYRLIDDNYLKENNEINLLLNDNNTKVINLEVKRKIYSNKDYDLVFIELKNIDKINNYFELDENLFSQEELKEYYENKAIYIIQYLNMEKVSVSYGILTEFTEKEIKHTCSIKPGSFCSPILSSINNAIIGFSKEIENNRINNNFNKGFLLKLPIIEFKNQLDNNKKEKTGNTNNNISEQKNTNKNISSNNNKINEFDLITEKPKMMIVFKTGKGFSYGFETEYGITIEELLKNFIKNVTKKDCVNIKKAEIKFLFNSVKLNDNEKALKTVVEKYFKNRRLPTIIVISFNIYLIRK